MEVAARGGSAIPSPLQPPKLTGGGVLVTPGLCEPPALHLQGPLPEGDMVGPAPWSPTVSPPLPLGCRCCPV